jgi:hypothetical protein
LVLLWSLGAWIVVVDMSLMDAMVEWRMRSSTLMWGSEEGRVPLFIGIFKTFKVNKVVFLVIKVVIYNNKHAPTLFTTN